MTASLWGHLPNSAKLICRLCWSSCTFSTCLNRIRYEFRALNIIFPSAIFLLLWFLICCTRALRWSDSLTRALKVANLVCLCYVRLSFTLISICTRIFFRSKSWAIHIGVKAAGVYDVFQRTFSFFSGIGIAVIVIFSNLLGDTIWLLQSSSDATLLSLLCLTRPSHILSLLGWGKIVHLCFYLNHILAGRSRLVTDQIRLMFILLTIPEGFILLTIPEG